MNIINYIKIIGNKMSNQERLKEYLVGTNGYLKSDISNGKVIMLSGKWGSGKTHFWQNKIQTILNDKDEKIPNHYISLYGKTSIDEIRNEVFLKIFESVDSFEFEEKGTKLAKNTVDLISLFTKSVGIDLSKFTDKPFENFQKMLDDKKLKKTEEYLNSGAIICFDDFERKSKDIDLNDLFGFITQLTLNFSCKVVIILNDDVFEGEEKKIFSRVKEKSVSKFLKYEPSIKDLFNLIFYGRKEDNKKKFKYLELRRYKQIILKTIKETEKLNARIYIQVLDNLVEWIGNKQEINDDVLRCLILVNINFILNHIVFTYTVSNMIPEIFMTEEFSIKFVNLLKSYLKNYTVDGRNKFTIIDNLRNDLKNSNEIELVNKNKKLIWTVFNYEINLKYRENISNEQLNKINNFIETGILINE